MDNVILVGFRGTGKSSVAELVALATNRSVYHMDDAISSRAGCSIAEFVERYGWETFWKLEADVVAEVAERRGLVIDTGGGVVRHEEGMRRLKASGAVFWLTARPSTIKERIRQETERPSLTGRKSFLDEVEEVLEAREPLYSRYADHVVETDGRTLSEIAQEIIELMCAGQPLGSRQVLRDSRREAMRFKGHS